MLSSPHRVMFPAAGFAAILGVFGLWSGVGDIAKRTPLPGLYAWHAHEMVFGFAAAGLAGYALTAMRSWSVTGSPSPRSVGFLLWLWVIARLVALGAVGNTAWIVVPAGSGFMVFLSVQLGWAVIRSRSWKGAVQALVALLLTLGQIASLLGAKPPVAPVLVLAALVSIVGGRMVSAFSWNRVSQYPGHALRFRLAAFAGLLAACAIVCAAVIDSFDLHIDGRIYPAVLLLAAGSEGMRIWFWQSCVLWQDRALMMMHLAFAWLPVGLALLALAAADPGWIIRKDALHAVTLGAVGGSIYAVAARAVARRAKHLTPVPVDLFGFTLLEVATALRVMIADRPMVAGVVWVACWVVFLVRHWQALYWPAPRPVFSGPRMED